MKTKTHLTMTAVVLLAACPAQAVDKDFYSSGQILPGEEWNSVYVYNDDTVVDMLGGFVDGCVRCEHGERDGRRNKRPECTRIQHRKRLRRNRLDAGSLRLGHGKAIPKRYCIFA